MDEETQKEPQAPVSKQQQDSQDLELFCPGHRACAGCGASLAVRWILKATGPNVIVITPTGCLETFSSRYPESPWKVPWLHPLFENAAAVASGVEAALKAKKMENPPKVLVIGGDGATFDIGIGALSGMFERGHDISYICYDNEAYMNTGVQRSAATPYAASTTTEPAGNCATGKSVHKKDMPRIAAAHGISYVATSSIAYPKDILKKVEKSVATRSPTYLQIHSPCCIGWGYPESKTIEMARLAVETGLVPIFEMENGEVTRVKKIKKRKPVQDYLGVQSRFSHLFEKDNGNEELASIQELADANAARYGIDIS